MKTVRTVAHAFASVSYAWLFLPTAWLFLHGIDQGMRHIDSIYPYPQPRKPLHDHPTLIYIHMYANTTALGLQLSLLRLHPPAISRALHGKLAWVFVSLVVIGTNASILYSTHQNYGADQGKSGILAFGTMALATFYTLATALYYARIRRNATLHREWSIRNFAVLFGNGVVFRLLANTYLVYIPRWGADFYASWCQMIWLSWLLPLSVAEQYLAWERASADERERLTLKGE